MPLYKAGMPPLPAHATAPGAPPHLPRALARKFPLLVRPGLWWVGFAVWLGVVFTLSSIAGPDLPKGPELPNLDKIVHALLYAGGAFTLVMALALSKPSAKLHPYLVGGLSLLLIGAVDELYQLRTPGRTGADPLDWLADAVGAITTCLVLALLRRRA